MNHLDEVQLNAWADKRLSEEDQAIVDLHLDQCIECRRNADILLEIWSTLNDLKPVIVTPAMEKNVIKAFRQEVERSNAAANDLLNRRWISAYPAIVAGIVAGLILGHLINPLITKLDSEVMMTENTQVSEDLYLNRLIADNGSDLW